MAEANPYALLADSQTSANPYALLADDVEDNTLPITEHEFLEQQRQANKESVVEKEYQKYQDPRVYEDAATPAELRKMSTIALDPLLPLGPEGETGLTGLSKMVGLPTDRSTFAMGGALAGEAAGYKLAGKTGIAPGGVLGSGIASMSFDTLDALTRFLQSDPEQELTPDIKRLGEQLSAAGETMQDEMVAQSGGRVITKAFGGVKNMWAKFLGTKDPQVAELSSLATQFKVPLGIVQAVDKNKWAKGFTRVLGVLPYVSTPFQESSEKITERLGKNMHEMMDAFSPNINASSTVSTQIVNRANKAFDLFHARSDQLFGRWFNLTKQLPPDKQAFIPTSKLKQAAQTVVDQFEAGKSGTQELRTTGLVDWARNALTFKSTLTPVQFKAQMEDLHRAIREANEIIKTADPEEKLSLGPGNIMKIAMESDLNSPRLNFAGKFKDGKQLPSDEIIREQRLTGEGPIPIEDLATIEDGAVTGRMITQAFQRANTFFEKGLKRFETSTAKKFKSVDKGVFKASFEDAGPQEQDQLFRKLFNMDSVLGIKHLQQLVGKSNVLNGLRTVIDQAMEKTEHSLLDELPKTEALASVKKALGIGTTNGELVLAQALKGSKVTVDSIQNLFKLIESSDSVFNPKVSSFLARRLTLAGPAAFAGGVGTGGYFGGSAGAFGTMVGIATSILLLRKGSRYLTNPENLKTMVRALDDSLAPRVRRNAYARLVADAEDAQTAIDIGRYAVGEEDSELPAFDTSRATAEEIQNLSGKAGTTMKSIIDTLPSSAIQKIQNAIQVGTKVL